MVATPQVRDWTEIWIIRRPRQHLRLITELSMFEPRLASRIWPSANSLASTLRPNVRLLPHLFPGIMRTRIKVKRFSCFPELPENPSRVKTSTLSGAKPQERRPILSVLASEPPPILIKHRNPSGVPLGQAIGTLLFLFLLFYFLCYIVTH